MVADVVGLFVKQFDRFVMVVDFVNDFLCKQFRNIVDGCGECCEVGDGCLVGSGQCRAKWEIKLWFEVLADWFVWEM